MLSGWKDFDAGDILTAADLQNYIQNQVVLHFDNTSSRDVAFSVVAPEAGMISYVDTQGFLELYNGTSWGAINIGSPLSGGFPLPEGRAPITTGGSQIASWQQVSQAISPNYIINGAFDIWQRGTSFSYGAGVVYHADRWQTNTSAVLALTVSRANSGLSDFRYSYRVQRTSGSSATGTFVMGNSFETSDSIPLASKTISFSFWARSGANYSGNGILSRVFSGTGTDQSIVTGFTGQSIRNDTLHTLTTSWARYSVTATIPSNATQVGVRFESNWSGTAGADDWFEITGTQLEAGSVATPFKRNTNSIQGELAACQRYFERVEGNGSFFGPGFVNSATLIYGVYTYKVEKRVTPSYSSSSATAVSAFSATTGTVTTTANSAANLSSTKVGVVQATVSGFTGGQGGMLGITTGSFIDFSAEL